MSSSIFNCLTVKDRWHLPNLYLLMNYIKAVGPFTILRHKGLILTQFYQKTTGTALNWPSTTKYNPVPSYTVMTQYHQVQVPTSTTKYWPGTTKYKPVPPYADPIPATTNQYCPKRPPLPSTSLCYISLFLGCWNIVDIDDSLVGQITTLHPI